MKASHGSDGITARNGTSQTAYQGKTFGESRTEPPIRGIARSASGARRRHAAAAMTQRASAPTVTHGASITERISPGLKYSCVK